MKNIFLSPLPFNGLDFGPGFEPGRGPVRERAYLFVVISVVIHALALLVLVNLPRGGSALLMSVKERPLDIEIVQLPETASAMGELKSPKKITAYAQRTQSVETEEYPMIRGSSDTMILPSQGGKPSIILVRPQAGGDGDGGGEGGGEGREAPVEPKAAAPAPSAIEGTEMSAMDEAKAPDDGDGAITLRAMSTPDSSAAGVLPDIGAAGDGKEGTGGEPREGLVLIPSRGALQQIARQESAGSAGAGVESPRTGSGTTLLLNTSEFRFQKYFMSVKRRIEFFWDYPPIAARNGQQGRLKIDFVILKDGSVKRDGIEILKSSNYPILDDAATTALRLASPFNPFPEGFDLEEITVHGSFEYNLYRRR